VATVLAFTIPTAIIYIKRRDLIIDSLVSGVVLVVIASLVYTVVNMVTPDWANAFWHFENVPSIILFSLPIDDIFWYFLAGSFIGPLYEYWQESRLIRKK